MKKLLLTMSAVLLAVTGAKAETVLEIGEAYDIWGYSYVNQETFLQKDYKVDNLEQFKVDGYSFYIQSFYGGSNLVCVDPETKYGYFQWNNVTYFEISAPDGEYINNFTFYCCGPENAGKLGIVDGQNCMVTVVPTLDMAQAQRPIGEVTYSEPDQMEISWTNTTSNVYNKVCVRTPAFSSRQIYRVVINSSTPAINVCTMTASPSPKAKLYAGSCGTAEAPEGLAALRINFDQTDVTLNPDPEDIITLFYGDQLLMSWDEPDIMKGEDGYDYCLLPGLNAKITRNPGEYVLKIPDGFFMFDEREVHGGNVTYKLDIDTVDMLEVLSPEQSDDLTSFNSATLGFGSEFAGIQATGAFKTEVYREGLIQPVSTALLGNIDSDKGTITLSFMNDIEGPGNFDIAVSAGSFVVCRGTEEWGPYVYNSYLCRTFSLAGAPGAVDTLQSAANAMDVYGIDGRLVSRQANGLEGLAKGLYIVGGRKVIVR